MPVDAIRSVADHMDKVLRHTHPRRIVMETQATDKALFFRYFKGYRPEKIGRGRIRKMVEKEILAAGDGNAFLANLLIMHWNDAHGPLYRAIVTHVQAINEDVEAIEQIEDNAAHDIIDDLVEKHSLQEVLISVRLNGVRFREELIADRLVEGNPRPTAG